ncbi:MAG: insulinase family protein [Alphaproteobacteria bacterium]|nr:insulinase family protein [Alphaproteobacteria bacterium]
MAHRTQVTTLTSGLRVVSADMAGAETVSVGFWVNAGARDEHHAEHGLAHMLEHMAFKGTAQRSAADIAREVEDKGGYINAHTSREETAYYLRLMAEDLDFGIDLLADILINSTYPEDEIDREKGVIIQEIGQAMDTPDDVVFDLFQQVSHPANPMGRPILGTVDCVSAFSRDDLFAFQRRYYAASSIVVSAAGRVDHDKLVPMVEAAFAGLDDAATPTPRLAPTWPGEAQSRREIMTRDLEQAHLVVGLPGLSFADEDRLALSALAIMYGGGMSSRLFQEAREKRGLCYSVFAFGQSFSDSGVMAVYAGTSQDDTSEMIKLAGQELVDLAGHATPEETVRAVAQMRASLRMQQESVTNVGEAMARQMMIYGELKSPSQWLAEMDAITVDDIRRVAAGLLTHGPVLAGIGPGQGRDWLDEDALKACFAA